MNLLTRPVKANPLSLILAAVMLIACNQQPVERTPSATCTAVMDSIAAPAPPTGSMASSTGTATSATVEPLDSTGLEAFWRAFQTDVKADRRSEVLRVLDYPMHESLIHDWHFSVDCDTAYYASHGDQFNESDITPHIAPARYTFLFTKELQDMIARTDLSRILKEGHVSRRIAVTFHFWAKNYGYGCGSDIALHFHFHRTADGWRLGIATV